MRIATMVLTVVLCAAAVAAAEDHGTPRDGLFCSERCDADYQSCMRWRRGKGSGDCPGVFVRCRDACASPAARAAAKRAEPPPSCREACQADFDGCLRRDNGKHSDACAKSIIVCRNGCPEEPPAAASAPVPARVDEPQHAAPTAPAAGANAAADEPQHAAPATPPAVGNRAADAPAIGPAAGKVPPSAPPRNGGKSPKAARGVGKAADGARSSTSIAATADPAPSSAVAVPASGRRPSALSRAWCALTGSCGTRAAKGPVSCDDACTEAYDTCIAHEDPKRGGECATSSVRCRQGCAEHPTTKGTER
jgi:hypothetical protein